MRGSLVLTENAGSRLYGQLRVIQLLLGKILKVGWSGFRGGFRVCGLGLRVKGVEVGGQICLGSMVWGLGRFRVSVLRAFVDLHGFGALA